MIKELQSTIETLSARGRGLLAADESMNTIAKRFANINVEATEENRRRYRELLFTTPNLGEYICGVILFEETLKQKTKNGVAFPELLRQQNIIPDIKVDKGLVKLPNSPEDQVTQGLDGLADRLAEYKKMGAQFTKWRAVFEIGNNKPSDLAITANAEMLARYAAICQSQGFVPIVEPEVLIDGNHNIEQCAFVSEKVLTEVFYALARHEVVLEYIVLKPSMVISGKDAVGKASVNEVAEHTIRVLKRTVPAAVATINFLSGGQTPEQATANLNAMNARFPMLPWNLSFSYARALQDLAMKLWQGKDENAENAQAALYYRARLNAAAALGEYSESLEK